MSCDYAVWNTEARLSREEAIRLYRSLCDGDESGVSPSPAVDSFYTELTSIHPELTDVSDDDVDNLDLCPWSAEFDRSPGHLVLCCAWPKAEYVGGLVRDLARKHGLAVFDPQSEAIIYPDSPEPRSWWRFWSRK